MQATTGEKLKKKRSRKKKKATRPKLKPLSLPLVKEEADLENGFGYEDVVPAPLTPRDKLQSDLERLEGEINQLPKFSPKWFKVKTDLAVVQIKLDEWENNTPTAATVSSSEGKWQSPSKIEEQPLQQIHSNNNKLRRKRGKNRPRLRPQSIVEQEEAEDEEGLSSLGYNDILLTKKQLKPPVIDEHTFLLDQVNVCDGGSKAASRDYQDVACRFSDVGDLMLRVFIGILFCVIVFKILLP